MIFINIYFYKIHVSSNKSLNGNLLSSGMWCWLDLIIKWSFHFTLIPYYPKYNKHFMTISILYLTQWSCHRRNAPNFYVFKIGTELSPESPSEDKLDLQSKQTNLEIWQPQPCHWERKERGFCWGHCIQDSSYFIDIFSPNNVSSPLNKL